MNFLKEIFLTLRVPALARLFELQKNFEFEMEFRVEREFEFQKKYDASFFELIKFLMDRHYGDEFRILERISIVAKDGRKMILRGLLDRFWAGDGGSVVEFAIEHCELNQAEIGALSVLLPGNDKGRYFEFVWKEFPTFSQIRRQDFSELRS